MGKDDFYDSLFGSVYSFYMERPRLSRAIGCLLWGGNTGRYYASMATIAEDPRPACATSPPTSPPRCCDERANVRMHAD